METDSNRSKCGADERRSRGLDRAKHLFLPPGRIWFEADFDYAGGYRNSFRFLYSNDALIFVTYDHYATFYEIDTEGVL